MLEDGYDGARAYRQSKLAQIMHAFDLAEELAGEGVTATALHPATFMPTKMVTDAGVTPASTVEEGSRPPGAWSPTRALDGVTGAYFNGTSEARADAQAYDARRAPAAARAVGAARRLVRCGGGHQVACRAPAGPILGTSPAIPGAPCRRPTHHCRRLCLALLAGTGAAIAADGSSQITVHAPTQLKAGQTAPFDAPVKAIRRGKPIPAGYVPSDRSTSSAAPRRRRGAEFTCPEGKRLKTFGVTGPASSPTQLRGPQDDQRHELPAAAPAAGERDRLRGLPLTELREGGTRRGGVTSRPGGYLSPNE